MRDSFVDTATHELRTPLANIKAYAETLALADMIDVEQQKQFLNTINSEATRLARFVDDLLSVSSMELGSLSLNKQVTDLHRMLNEVLAKVRPQIEEKRLTFEVSLPEKLPEPELDKDKIATVLVNLLGNAVKYTPAGGRVTFRVNVTEQSRDRRRGYGRGHCGGRVAEVFDKFFRSHDPRVQEQTGTGLGLALVQEVVRLHGGQITVESEINKGSTFIGAANAERYQTLVGRRKFLAGQPPTSTYQLAPEQPCFSKNAKVRSTSSAAAIASGEHVAELATVLDECVRRGQPQIVLDLQGVAIMDSAGWNCCWTFRRMPADGRRLQAGERRHALSEVLKATGVGARFEIFATRVARCGALCNEHADSRPSPANAVTAVPAPRRRSASSLSAPTSSRPSSWIWPWPRVRRKACGWAKCSSKWAWCRKTRSCRSSKAT